MTPVDQAELHDPENGAIGDCLRACLASVLDLPSDAVPHIAREATAHGDTDEEGQHWWGLTQEFLQPLGLELWWVELDQLDAWWHFSAQPELLLCGPSPRGAFGHVVVGTPEGEITHDPHPSRDGLLSTSGFFMFVKHGTAETEF